MTGFHSAAMPDDQDETGRYTLQTELLQRRRLLRDPKYGVIYDAWVDDPWHQALSGSTGRLVSASLGSQLIFCLYRFCNQQFYPLPRFSLLGIAAGMNTLMKAAAQHLVTIAQENSKTQTPGQYTASYSTAQKDSAPDRAFVTGR